MTDWYKEIAGEPEKEEGVDWYKETFEREAEEQKAARERIMQQGQEGSGRSLPRRIDDIVRSIAEGASVGQADRIAAAAESALSSDLTYDEALAQQKARTGEIPEGERFAGNVAGTVAGAAALPLRAPAALANVARGLPAGRMTLQAPRTVGEATKQGAGLGALYGAGFSEAETPADLAVDVGAGGATGALGGAAGQGLIQGIGRMVARIRQGVNRPTAQAMDDVLREMNAGGITPQQAIQRLKRLGPEGMLADMPQLERLAQQTASRTATGANVARSAIEGRKAGASQRVNDALDMALQGRNPREVRAAVLQSRKQEADRLYTDALAGGPLELTDDLAGLIGQPGKKGVEGGSSLVRGQLESIRRSNPRFRDAPDTDPDLLHAVRVALADKSTGQGAAKRNINDIVQQLTDAMDDAGATGYRSAVDQYRTDSLTLKAFDEGRKALNALPEDISAFMKGASKAEKDSFVAGVGREIARQLETGETKAATTGVRNVLRGERAQVLREVLGPDEYKAFRDRMLREIEFAETAGRIRGGSPTQPRQGAAQEQIRQLGRVDRALRAVRGEGGSVVGAAAELATPRGTPNLDYEKALAQMLFRSQGQGLPSGRFAAENPLLELDLRRRLLEGATRIMAPGRAAARGVAGAAGGRAGEILEREGF